MIVLLSVTQENAPYIMNATIMLIGIFASFLSANLKKKVQITGLFGIAIFFNVITWYVYKDSSILHWTVIITIIWIFICLLLFGNREIVSRSRIDKMIRKFTNDSDQNNPIRIFGGDLDFFGKVENNVKSIDKIFHPNKYIETNKQFNQLTEKGFTKICILSVKPTRDNSRDKETRIRIGFLKNRLGDNLEIKFFDKRECHNCEEKDTCLACDICESCPKRKACGCDKVHKCEKLLKKSIGRCYNPDTTLRGRIANNKRDGSTWVAIVTTHKAGKSYILKEYSSNTKECTIYINIWEVWWKKCTTDNNFISKCIEEYNEFKENEVML